MGVNNLFAIKEQKASQVETAPIDLGPRKPAVEKPASAPAEPAQKETKGRASNYSNIVGRRPAGGHLKRVTMKDGKEYIKTIVMVEPDTYLKYKTLSQQTKVSLGRICGQAMEKQMSDYEKKNGEVELFVEEEEGLNTKVF